MLLDLSPLMTEHLVLFGSSFATMFISLKLMLRWPNKFFQSHPERRDVFFCGPVLIAILTYGLCLALPNWPLKISLVAAAILTVLVGWADERRPLPAFTQLAWQVVIVLIVVSGGWMIRSVSQLNGSGVWTLNWFIISGAFTALWLLLFMNAMNWLDGSDGLATGVGVVASFMLAAVTLLPSIQDGTTLSLALIGAGALLGFMLWNWPPAKVFLGTSGAWFVGLYLGLVAIVGGGKVVTTLLILFLPVIDMLLVTGQRLWSRQPPWLGDKQRHLHHYLLAVGVSSSTITVMAMVVTSLAGLAAILLQTRQKIVALLAAAVFLGVTVLILYKRTQQEV